MTVRKISPVLQVDEIESVLPFWEERLGFERVAEIPHGLGLGFVILVSGGHEVMLQSTASAAADVVAIARPASPGSTGLFIEVDDLAPYLARLLPGDHAAPVRETFYGMREAILRDPAGHVVALAQKL